MNIAYFGSPHISALLLKELLKEQHSDYSISLIVSQPDKPIGKKLEIRPTMVSEIASAYHIPLFNKPLKENEFDLIQILKNKNIDLCIIFAYGEILSSALLTIPKFGFWNIHPSLLPLYRGPSPIAYSLLLGDINSGVTLMKIGEKMDAGPIIEQVTTSIELQESRSMVEERLTLIGSTLLKKNLKKVIKNNEIVTRPQDNTLATYTSLLKKEDGYFNLQFLSNSLANNDCSIELLPKLLQNYLNRNELTESYLKLNSSGKIFYNFFRALSPWPGIWTEINTNKGLKRLKIIKASYINELIINEVQLEGKNKVDFKTFNKAYNIL